MADRKKILVVDDEPDMVTWLTTFLEDNGFATIAAYNGIEGFEKAKTDQPDLITLDMSMDKDSGVKMLRNVQETRETSKIPVIMITGVSGELRRFIDRSKKLQPPAGFFEKPIDREELIKAIKKILGEST